MFEGKGSQQWSRKENGTTNVGECGNCSLGHVTRLSDNLITKQAHQWRGGEDFPGITEAITDMEYKWTKVKIKLVIVVVDKCLEYRTFLKTYTYANDVLSVIDIATQLLSWNNGTEMMQIMPLRRTLASSS